MAVRIGHIEVEAFVQATEDETKVVLAITNLLHPGIAGLIERSSYNGHHRNPLIVFKATLTKERDLKAVMGRLQALGPFRDAVQREADQRLDEENVFHIRFDKQAAYLGFPEKWVAGESVDLRIKVLTYPFSREAALEGLKRLVDDACGPAQVGPISAHSAK